MKEIKDLTIADDFMFCYVMENCLDICKEVIECILQIKVKKIKTLVSQKKEKHFYESKAVFFDVFADDGRIFEIEMQNLPKGNILKRERFYQASIDTAQLRKR